MNKKVNIIAILVLLLLNFIIIKIYDNNKDNEINRINGIQKIYILQGKNQNWSIENYKLIISFHEFKTGWGEVHIIGNKDNIDINNLTFYNLDITMVDKFNSEKKVPLISSGISINVPGISPESNLNSGEISNEGKTKLDDYNLEEKYDVYATIQYKIKNGQLRKETFKLNIVTAISETNNQIKVLDNKK